MNGSKMSFICKFCIDPLHIMIIDKVVKFQTLWSIAPHLIEAFYRMGNLKEVVIVVAGVQRLVKMIIGDGM